MNVPFALLATCLLTASIYSSLAGAEQVDRSRVDHGRLVFSGAVVEPTCSMPTDETLAVGRASSTPPAAKRVICASGPGNATRASAVYSSIELRLSDAETNVVLKYFDAYVKAEDPTARDPVLVTHVYE